MSPLKGIAALFLDTKGRIVDDVIISRDNGDILVECSASNRKNLKSILEKYRMRKTRKQRILFLTLDSHR